VSKFELPETKLERTARNKSLVKPIWNKKMTVLSTYFKSSLNFPYNNLKKNYKICTVREKRGVKI